MLTDLRRSFGAVTPAVGLTTIKISIPDRTDLVGETYYTQFIHLNPAANALGITTSNALSNRIGGLRFDSKDSSVGSWTERGKRGARR